MAPLNVTPKLLKLKLTCSSNDFSYLKILLKYYTKVLSHHNFPHQNSYKMNNLINSSSSHRIQIQSSQEPGVEYVEKSIQNLLKDWHRRQRWNLFFNSTSNEHNLISTSPWRTNLVNFLESKQIRVIAVALILLDLILTTLELTSTILSCSASKNRRGNDMWYHWLGIAILSLLFAKTAALAVGLGGRGFLRRPGLIVDAVVVAGALVLEGFLERKGGGLLVVVSLWRIVRVIESAFELSDDAIEAQIEGIVGQFEGLKEENRRLLEIIDEKDRDIEKLREDLDRCREDCGGSFSI